MICYNTFVRQHCLYNNKYFLRKHFGPTTENNIFITDLPKEDFSILDQVKNNNGFASVTDNVGIGINPKEDFLKEFEVNE